MREAVSDILIDRAREVDGVSRMVMLSLVAHVVLVAVVFVLPEAWRSAARKPEQPVMTIVLGGAPGPDSGGLTPIAARPVQAVTEPAAKPQVDTPPAPKAPEMVVPEPASKPAPKLKPDEKPVDTKSRKPTTGAEVKAGDARVETGGAQVPFGGLSTGGGGEGARLDVQNFCCPAYIQTMVRHIKSQWKEQQGAAGESVVKFVIRRDGMLTNIELETSSNNPLLDLESRRAVINARQLPPLPAQFTEPTLTVHLTFEYKR